MSVPIASTIKKRFRLITLFLIISIIVSGWFFLVIRAFIPPTMPGLLFGERLFFWAYLVLFILRFPAAFFSFTLAMAWNLQFKISFRLRPGALIKYLFWLNGVFTIYSGIVIYLFLVEGKDFGLWPIGIFFIFDLLSLIMSMSVRYAIEEDVKNRKVCEFC